jgi:hypothetical protein
MVNSIAVSLLEVKYRVRLEHITKLLQTQMPAFRLLFPEYKNHKIILGVGGMSFEDEAIEEANKNGIGLIRINNDKVEFQTNEIKEY